MLVQQLVLARNAWNLLHKLGDFLQGGILVLPEIVVCLADGDCLFLHIDSKLLNRCVPDVAKYGVTSI